MAKPVRQLIEGGAALLILQDRKALQPCVAQVVAACRERRVPIITSAGAGQSAETSACAEREYSIGRPRCSAFYGTSLHVLLRELGVQTLILAGGETSVSVHYTFVDAHQHDYFCRVLTDSTAGSSPQAHEAALQAMEYMQAGARRNSAEVIAALNHHE